MGGLAITICKKSNLENIQTIGSEYYLPDYVKRQSLVRASSPNVRRLASICTLITDGDHGVADYQDDGIQFVLSGNVKEGWIDTSDVRKISSEHHSTLMRSSLKAGDVLVTKTGVYFGNSAVVPKGFGEANTIAHVGILRIKQGFNPYYVSTFLNSLYGYSQLRRRGMKATRPEIKLVEFNDIEVPFFGESLEAAICQLIDKAEKCRELANQHYIRTENALLTALGLADWKPPEPLYYVASSAGASAAGRLDAQYFMPAKRIVRDALAEMPGSTLGERFNSIRDMFDPKSDSAPALVRNYDLTDALEPILDDEKEPVGTEEIGSMKKVFKDGDVAISRLRAYLREIAVVRTSGALPAVGSSEFIVLRPRNGPENRISPETLLTFLRSTPVQTILKWCQDGSQHPRFSEGDLLSIHVPDAVAKASPKIEAMVKHGFESRRRSRELLDRAKRAVEIAIEDNEAAARRFLKEAGS